MNEEGIENQSPSALSRCLIHQGLANSPSLSVVGEVLIRWISPTTTGAEQIILLFKLNGGCYARKCIYLSNLFVIPPLWALIYT